MILINKYYNLISHNTKSHSIGYPFNYEKYYKKSEESNLK